MQYKRRPVLQEAQEYFDNRRVNIADARSCCHCNLLKKQPHRFSKRLECALPLLGLSRADRFSHARLETNNDESRFGLTRAPFSQRRGSLERGQSLVRHRVAQDGIELQLRPHT